jgi:hypothetical protein
VAIRLSLRQVAEFRVADFRFSECVSERSSGAGGSLGVLAFVIAVMMIVLVLCVRPTRRRRECEILCPPS